MSAQRLAFIIARCVAAGFAFSATAKHPYSFYMLVRWIVFATCCWGIFSCRQRLWPSAAPVYILIGVVFNPLVPLHFARATWHNLDIAAALLFLASLLINDSSRDSKPNDRNTIREI
jgi:hypothetical protein